MTYLCDIKEPWRSSFWGDYIVLTGVDVPTYMIHRDSIKEGDVLPRDSDVAIGLGQR